MKISSLVRKALQDAGIYSSESEAVPSDYLIPCIEMLRDVIQEANSQSAIVFEQSVTSVNVSGDVLTFMPYTDAEQAIIDGGGTVDITDRLVDFIPIQPPIAFNSLGRLNRVSMPDLLSFTSDSVVSCYAFNMLSDRSEIRFNAPSAGTVTVLRSVPIVMDDSPGGDVSVPVAFERYLVTKLAESIAIRYQFTETASIMAQRAQRQGQVLADSNISARPLRHNLAKCLDKFRRYA